MKRIITASLAIMLFASCTAQYQTFGHRGRYSPPPRVVHHSNHHHNSGAVVVGTAVGIGVGILIGNFVINRMPTHPGGIYYVDSDPTLWRGWPWFPRLTNTPFRFESTQAGNFTYLTSTHICMGVSLAGAVVITTSGEMLTAWDARTGQCLLSVRPYAGYSAHINMQTPYGPRVAQISWNGTAVVDYLDGNGQLLESYIIY